METKGLGQRVRRRRYELLLSQQDLADKAGVGRVTVARVETGAVQPSLRTLRGLARALDLEPHELLKGGDDD